MLFALGYLAGLATCVFIAVVGLYFKTQVTRWVSVAAKQIELAGPRPQGFLLEPEDDADLARQEIIARNAAAGQDTPISQLR